MQQIAKLFGTSLDQDDFEMTKKLLHPDCQYFIGEDVLIGPENICNSYEQNMIEGRKKLDVLEWGKSKIEPINNSEYYVHFTDYLTHIGKSFTHKCKQKLTINKENLIVEIRYVDDPVEQDRLNEYYKSVGLK